MGISQPAVCKALWAITEAIVEKAEDYIHLQTNEEKKEVRNKVSIFLNRAEKNERNSKKRM